LPVLRAPWDERRVAVAEAISYIGIDVLPNDKRALSLQAVPSLMTYFELIMAKCINRLSNRSSRRSPADFAAELKRLAEEVTVWIGILKLKTFVDLRELTENPDYQVQRQKSLANLTDDMIDVPIIGLINGFNKLPYCFTLQSCYGHFVYDGQENPRNLEPLPDKSVIAEVEYRIAYIVLCIENNPLGNRLFEILKKVPAIDPKNIQFCCAEWFWKKQVNSYALQVEPERFKRKDTAILDHKEALYIEMIRNDFFQRLYELVEKKIKY
jgi:hypothetical protein